LNDSLSLVLLSFVEHANRSQRVHAVHRPLLEREVIGKWYALESGSNHVLLVAPSDGKPIVWLLALGDSNSLAHDPPSHKTAAILDNYACAFPAGSDWILNVSGWAIISYLSVHACQEVGIARVYRSALHLDKDLAWAGSRNLNSVDVPCAIFSNLDSPLLFRNIVYHY